MVSLATHCWVLHQINYSVVALIGFSFSGKKNNTAFYFQFKIGKLFFFSWPEDILHSFPFLCWRLLISATCTLSLIFGRHIAGISCVTQGVRVLLTLWHFNIVWTLSIETNRDGSSPHFSFCILFSLWLAVDIAQLLSFNLYLCPV